MKKTIYSEFHDTEKIFNFKPSYCTGSLDVLSALDYEVYSQGPDRAYAKRKLAEIKRVLCGHAECQCPFFVG